MSDLPLISSESLSDSSLFLHLPPHTNDSIVSEHNDQSKATSQDDNSFSVLRCSSLHRSIVPPFRRLLNECPLVPLLGLITFIALALVLLVFVAIDRDTPLIIEVEQGQLRGYTSGQVRVFSHVPFAEPPVGRNRWMPPVKPAAWTGVYDATRKSEMCAQFDQADHGELVGQEDCLYLNIVTKANPKQLLPVLVFIHGGSSLTGYSQDPLYDHKSLVEERDIVAVTVNYRLNVFGYLSLNVLSQNYYNATSIFSSGNYGLRDNIAALQWVKTNIDKFGGDPNRVTVYGQSTGGTNVMALYVSPLARGLFHGALSLSSSPVLRGTLEEANVQNSDFLTKTGCTQLASWQQHSCLLSLSTYDVLLAMPERWKYSQDAGLPNSTALDAAIIIVDGPVVPMELNAALRAQTGSFNTSLVFSHMAQEIDFSPLQNVSALSSSEFSAWLGRRARLSGWNDTQANYLVNTYRTRYYFEDSQLTYEILVNDIIACGGVNNLNNAVASGARNIHHMINHMHPNVPTVLAGTWPMRYAGHMWDLLLMLYTTPPGYSMTPNDRLASGILRRFVVDELMMYGRVYDTINWPAYTSTNPITFELMPGNSLLRTTEKWRGVQCDNVFWYGFGNAGWAN